MSIAKAIYNLSRLTLQGQWRIACYQVKTRWHSLDLRSLDTADLGLDPSRSKMYSDSGGPHLDVVFKTLPVSPADEILDIGCGKGGAMITLARYPFARVDGLDLSKKLVDVANRNFRLMGITKCASYHGDAAEFQALDRYTYFYMYNPFPAVVVSAVLNNICNSVARRHRKVTLVYKNPIAHEIAVAAGFRKIREFLHSNRPFYVYTLE